MRALDDVAGAVTDRQAVDWSAAVRRAGEPQERRFIDVLSGLAQIRPAHDAPRTYSPLDRRLPVVLEGVKWVAMVGVLAGAVGTSVAIQRLGIPRLPFVLAVLVTFAAAGLYLDVSGRDKRSRLLGFVYWVMAAAFGSSGVVYLSRIAPPSTGLEAVAALHAEAFLAPGLWYFVREFPKPHVGSRVDAACRVMSRLSLGASLVVVGAALGGGLSALGLQAVTMMLAVPAMVVLLVRWRTADSAEAARVRWFVLGLAVALAPMAAAAVTEFFVPRAGAVARSPSAAVLYLPLLALPVLTAYAVAATTVLPVRVLLHAGARRALARHVPLWTGLVVGALVVLRFALSSDRTLADVASDPGMRALLWTGVAMAGLVVLRPVILPLLDKWQPSRREPHAYVLARLTERLRHARTELEVGDAFAEAVERALYAPTHRFLLRLGRLEPVVAGAHALPVHTCLPVLLGVGEPCVVGEGLSRSLFQYLHPDDQVWATRQEVAAVAPLGHRRGATDVQGMLVVQRRRDALDLTSEDREFLKTCSAAAALACDSLHASASPDAAGLDDVALQCDLCGRVESWTSATETCACGGGWSPAVLPKRLAGRLDVRQWLGAGGMGAVFRATDTTLRRDVALKTLALLSPEAAGRALEEARAMANVSHPNVAVLYGSDSWKGTPVLEMEYLAGGTLTARLRQGPVDPRLAAGIVDQLADALQAIHALGRFHGDVKPSNIGFTASGSPKLLDFGLSASFERSDEEAVPSASDTLSGPTWGTPAYLSPEAWAGAAPGPGLDVWALSVVFSEMLLGSHPYRSLRDAGAISRRVAGVVAAHRARLVGPSPADARLEPLPAEPVAPAVPAPMCDLIEDTLRTELGRRPATMAAFRAALQRALRELSVVR